MHAHNTVNITIFISKGHRQTEVANYEQTAGQDLHCNLNVRQGGNLYFVPNNVVNMDKSIDAPAENFAPLYVFLPGSQQFWHEKENKKKKINKDVQD